MSQFTGGCLSGNIRYSAIADPIFMSVCHCKDCQRATGSAFGAVAEVPEASVTIQGKQKFYTSKGDTDNNISHSFRPERGGTLLSTAAIIPNVIMLTTGTLDDTSAFKLTMQIYCGSAKPCLQPGGAMKSFPNMPPPG